jgi:NADP-dependent 3-hydroxy acid dehydrogenase YdfG
MEIHNSVVIITGASSGLGEATARLFAARGAKVALVARSADALNHLTAELPGSLAIPTDMRDAHAIARMVATVYAHYQRIDVLINNAGQGMVSALEHTAIEQYRQLVELNLFGPLLAMQAVIPIMRTQGGGMIINVSSGSTKIAMVIPGIGAYHSTKCALNAITSNARAELAVDNIRVGIIYPGMMETAFGSHVLGVAPDWSHSTAGQSDSAPPMPPMLATETVAAGILDAVREEMAEQYLGQTWMDAGATH